MKNAIKIIIATISLIIGTDTPIIMLANQSTVTLGWFIAVMAVLAAPFIIGVGVLAFKAYKVIKNKVSEAAGETNADLIKANNG